MASVFSLFFFVVDDDDDGFVVAVVVVIWFSVGAIVVVDFFKGVFSFSLHFLPGSSPLPLCQGGPQFQFWGFHFLTVCSF